MNIAFANRLIEFRKNKGLSQEELAEKLGVSRQAVSKWERAESSPEVDNLILLSRIYGIGVDELLGEQAPQDGMNVLDQAYNEPSGSIVSPTRGNEAEEEPVRELCCDLYSANLELTGRPDGGFGIEIVGSDKQKEGIHTVIEGGRLSIVQDEPSPMMGILGVTIFGGGRNPQIRVSLPASMTRIQSVQRGGKFSASGIAAETIEAKTGGGSIVTEGCRADSIVCKTGGGSVAVRDTEATAAELVTGGGSVTAEDLRAEKLEVKTGGGSIRVSASASEVEALCGGGSINLAVRDALSVKAKTGGGGVSISLGDASGVEADLATAGGFSEFVWKGESLASSRKISLSVGDGSVKVHARSGGGSIHLNA